MSITIATILALAGALLFGISAVTERTGTKKVKRERALSAKFLLDLVRQPVWLFGIGATVLGNILHIFALDKGPLSLVEPLMVCALVFATLAISLGACLAVTKRSSALRPLALALASGISTGVGAFLIKLVTEEFSHGLGHVFTNWPIYGLAVLGPLGFMLNQKAFQHSTRVSQVLSIVTTVNPVVAVALGVGLLDEKIRHSPLAITGEAVSLVLAIVGIVAIAYHSPQAKQKAEAGNVRAGY